MAEIVRTRGGLRGAVLILNSRTPLIRSEDEKKSKELEKEFIVNNLGLTPHLLLPIQ